MKILVVNPNISESVTALIDIEARESASPGTEITSATVSKGVSYIETPAESVMAASSTFEYVATCYKDFDAIIIAAYGDPGVQEAKELFPKPVIGLTEAAATTAYLLGGRFGIVGISQRMDYWYHRTLKDIGLDKRFVGYLGLGQRFANVGTVQSEARTALEEMCAQMVAKGADSIILAGAPLAGLARTLADAVPVPLVDGVGSAVRMAESIVRAQFRPRRAGALSPPPRKPNAGFPSDLSRLYSEV